MKIGILGTGMVGETLGKKLAQLGHEVRMGSRDAKNPKAAEFVKAGGAKCSQGTFADAAKFGEVIFNCTAGTASLEALKAAGAENLGGKVLVDVSNPLDFSKGFPPSLSVTNTDSLGEQIQRAFPSAKVVKTLNTVNAGVMVEPKKLANGAHDLFVCGNDAGAKETVTGILRSFGWERIVDLGDITGARAAEAYLLLWVRLMGGLKTAQFNLQIVR
jgi:predicted dinucleotide-binding enzyme